MLINCPSCRCLVEWESAPFRPFCSERCRLVDLGAWLTEQRALPGEPAPGAGGDEEGDPPVPSS